MGYARIVDNARVPVRTLAWVVFEKRMLPLHLDSMEYSLRRRVLNIGRVRRLMREQDTFEPEDDPYDDTVIEEDLPDETDAERHICLKCGNIMLWLPPEPWYCPECGD